MADTPAPLPSLGLLDGLGTAVAPSDEPALVWQEPLPAAFFADIGFAALYAWMPLGIPVNARDEVADSVNQGGDPAFLPHIGLVLAVNDVPPEPEPETIRGRRRTTRTYKAPEPQREEEPAPNVKPKLTPPTTTLVPDAQHLVVASASKAERLAKSATVKRRMAIEMADERALEELLMTYF